jgi:stage IV sporulation protein A
MTAVETKKSDDIYETIAARTGGDIYIGVVGPVRTGKSTFIKQFMEKLVIPQMENGYLKDRAVDELPQSAGGRTIMTTEPKFIPQEGAVIRPDDALQLTVRLIDCVGYVVPSALGYIEKEQPRLVQTPWFDHPVPFNMAAEVGTHKVISEHATIGVVVTTDGSLAAGEIPREEYQAAEARVIQELQALHKPFVVLLNCVEPESEPAKQLASQLTESYHVPVLAVNILQLDRSQLQEILRRVLYEFPMREIAVTMPRWVTALEKEHWLKKALFDCIREHARSLQKIEEVYALMPQIANCTYVSKAEIDQIDLATGRADVTIQLADSLFYQVVGEVTGFDLSDESMLMPLLQQLAQMKKEYDKLRGALEEVEATGYGIVMPSMEDLELEEPQIVRQGGKYGVRLKASAPSIHMMKANITTEVAPIVGSERQSEDLVRYLMAEFEENPQKIWSSNIFGKSLHELVNEGLHNKLSRMPSDARLKLQETIERIINEGCSGLICLIL